jgi:Zn finger protein HypA/HybF involved in hydrogenase expression
VHEAALVRDLLNAAEDAAAGEKIRSLRLAVGVLGNVDPVHLRRATEFEATRRWGGAPRVEVVESGSPGVRLIAVGV